MGYYVGEKINLHRKWKDARPEIQAYIDDMYACCIETGVSTGLAESSYVSTFWASGVPNICELLVVVLTDDTVKWSFDSGVTWAIVYDPTPVVYPETGMVTEYAGDENNVPVGWLLCDGSEISRTTYADLYAITGDTYGNGDGSTTFDLPDLRAKSPIGVNEAGSPNGANGSLTTRASADLAGAETHTVVEGELASHTHTTNASGSKNITSTTVTYVAAGAATSSSTGDDGSHNNIQPSTVVNYIIKT